MNGPGNLLPQQKIGKWSFRLKDFNSPCPPEAASDPHLKFEFIRTALGKGGGFPWKNGSMKLSQCPAGLLPHLLKLIEGLEDLQPSDCQLVGWDLGLIHAPRMKQGNRCGHFGVGTPPILVYFSGDWDVHWGFEILTRGQIKPDATL